ncbi:MAG TPA: iron ABC transporter permease [Cellulomonas sp.]
MTTVQPPLVPAGRRARGALARDAGSRRAVRRTVLLVLVGLVVVGVAGVAGLAFGSHQIDPADVVAAFVAYDPTNSDHVVVRQSRVPRVALGLVVGAALGVAGMLMQSITRNPIADPGLLGVNAGAAAGIVIAIAYLGVVTPLGYVWFAFAGAAVAAVLVFVVGSARRSAATPARMALAGAALTMAISAVTGMVLVSNEPAFLRFRYWSVGTLQGRGTDVLAAVLPFVLAGLLLAAGLTRVLNTLALGDDSARGLGVHATRARIGSAVAVVLLAGAATAAAGPIGFIGLTVPHVARGITGPDQRWVLPYSMVLAPILLLSADIVGRVIARPGEIEVGIVTAFIGAPVFILLAGRRRIAAL